MTTLTRRLGVPLNHSVRGPAIVMLVVAAAVHVPIIPEHLHEAPYIGGLFVALTVACFALALTLAEHDTAAVYGAAAVVSALAFIGYVLSRTVGLPQIGDDVGNWLDPMGVTAIISEGLVFLLATTVVAQPVRRRVAAG